MALCYNGQLICTYNNSKVRFAIRDKEVTRFFMRFRAKCHASNHQICMCTVSISDRNLPSVTVNARRLCFTASSQAILDSNRSHLHETFRMGYYAFHQTHFIS